MYRPVPTDFDGFVEIPTLFISHQEGKGWESLCPSDIVDDLNEDDFIYLVPDECNPYPDIDYPEKDKRFYLNRELHKIFQCDDFTVRKGGMYVIYQSKMRVPVPAYPDPVLTGGVEPFLRIPTPILYYFGVMDWDKFDKLQDIAQEFNLTIK